MLIEKFISKSNKEIEIHLPEKNDLENLLDFANRLIEDDNFLMFGSQKLTREEEEKYLDSLILSVQNKTVLAIFAKFNGRIIGACDIYKGRTRKAHVGTVGVTIDRDFRGDGIGKKLLSFILDNASNIGLKMACLDLFDINEEAKSLYKKYGFIEYGRLSKALLWRGKYCDEIMMYKDI